MYQEAITKQSLQSPVLLTIIPLWFPQLLRSELHMFYGYQTLLDTENVTQFV